jgi:hypothetical protein
MSKSNALLLSFTLVLTGLSTASILHPHQAAHLQTDYEEYLIVETTTEQKLAQKNVGSGESININCAKNLISSVANAVCSIVGVEPEPEPEPGTPTIEIRSVHCTDLTATQRGVAVEFTVFGIEHDSEELTFDVLVISSEGIEHAAEITIPANAPNPATTFIGFSLPLEEGEHTILAFINGEEVRKTFVAPSC